MSSSSEYTTTSSEFFASYCPCLGFRSWFRAQSWFWTRVNLGHLCQRFLPCFVPRLLSQPSYCPSFQFSVSKILSQFLYRPSFGSSFFVLAQDLHQVYGGGILAVIMHHIQVPRLLKPHPGAQAEPHPLDQVPRLNPIQVPRQNPIQVPQLNPIKTPSRCQVPGLNPIQVSRLNPIHWTSCPG